MGKRILFLLFTLLVFLAQINVAAASGSNGYQPAVPDCLRK